MEALTVKFGTPRPLQFREYDRDFPGVDLDLAVRIAGKSAVSAWDAERYPHAPDVESKIRELAVPTLKACLESWPEGKSVVRGGGRNEIAAYFDRALSEAGIRSQTELISFRLTEESEQLYKTIFTQAAEAKNAPFGWDHILEENHPGMPPDFRPDDGDGGYNPNFRDFRIWLKPMDSPEQQKESGNAPGDKFCRQCGTRRAEGGRFCAECGAPFGP